MVTLVRARSIDNKLEVCDDRPFVVELQLHSVTLRCTFNDLISGQERVCVYWDTEEFKKEWEIIQGLGDKIKVEKFDIKELWQWYWCAIGVEGYLGRW